MIERLLILGVEVLVTSFSDTEHGVGRIEARRKAVARLVRERLGEEVRLSHRQDGSPVVDGSQCGPEVSVSHCQGLAALAVGGRERIGVDIETPRATLRRVTRKFISEREADYLASDNLLLMAWTAKEALYKAAGIKGVDFANEVVLGSVGEGVGWVRGRRFRVAHVSFGEAMIAVAIP